jgi:hypothetical protein
MSTFARMMCLGTALAVCLCTAVASTAEPAGLPQSWQPLGRSTCQVQSIWGISA